ncbi:MAG: hypothetical protein KJ749_07450 [Planctomycetes bacterium]|nr:hypothetical protein [Planctomycetota bacterium]
MNSVVRHSSTCLLLAFLFGAGAAMADSVFTIEDPPVDFEVIDADDGSGEFFYDGIGDFGPYSTFNDALVGTVGECRSMGEFDISPFTVPAGESISAATFEVRITDIDIFGLGVDGETPESLACDGYVANGLAELSDFQAGDGNVLDSVATPNPQVGQIISFDVTSYVTALVNAQEPYVGLTVRAETFGGLMMEEGSGYPKLTIETGAAYGLGDLNCDGAVNAFDIDPFVLALTDPAGYAAAWPNCDIMNGDINGDGVVNAFDIDPFVDLLTGP